MGVLGRDELADLRAAASIFVAPARYEPFGLAALEAARAGCSLVLGDIPSLREVWGNAALFVDPGDHHALRGALERLIADGGLRDDMARRARLRAARYRSDRMAAAYVRLYRRVRPTAADGATA